MVYLFAEGKKFDSQKVDLSHKKSSSSHFFQSEEERQSIERKDQMLTTTRQAQMNKFNQGLLVNRIFTHTINGQKENAQ